MAEQQSDSGGSQNSSTKSKPGETKAAPDKDGSAQFQSAADKLRETSKWLVAAFGALGAALITSLSLSDLQGLTGSDLALAIIGFALGLLGACVAIAATARVLKTTTASVQEVVKDESAKQLVDANASVLGGFSSIDKLVTVYTDAQKDRVDSYLALLGNGEDELGTSQKVDTSDQAERSGLAPQVGELDPRQKFKYDRARKTLLFTSPIVERVLGFVAFDRLRRKFDEALRAVGFGVFIAGIGVGLFAYFSNAQEEPSAEMSGAPVEAQVNLAPAGARVLRDALGPSCDLDAVSVLVVDASEASIEAISLPENQCEVRRFTITPEMGIVCPVDQATPPLPDDPDNPDPSGGFTGC
jgi:hypothetical protein